MGCKQVHGGFVIQDYFRMLANGRAAADRIVASDSVLINTKATK